jgi:putative redox protein
MKAMVKYVGGLAFLGKARTNHWVPMDSSQEGLPPAAATSPKEMFLLAVLACTGMDVASLLNKRRIAFRSLEVEGEAAVAEEHPRVFTRIDLVFKLEGENVPVPEIERAIKSSQEKYCSVSAMMRKNCPIFWTATLNGAQVLSGGGAA